MAAVVAILILASGGTSPGTGPGVPVAGPPGTAGPGTVEVPAEVATTIPTTADERVLPVGIQPARILIPRIGVDAVTVDLDLRGPEPEVPRDFAQVGWYYQTRQPGEIGPAVMAGHIDSARGPAVFHRLDELVVGDQVIVEDGAGTRRTFSVTGSGQYPKEALPDEVFGFAQPVPQLRLITCGGAFDRTSGHYRDNYVVYASEVSS